MRHPLSFLPAFLLLSIAVSIEAFVVPWSRSDSAQFSATQRHDSAEPQQPYKSRNVLPNLTWLRDFTIEKVFRVPKPGKAGSDRPGSLPHPSSSELPNTLLAKYGGDVVLRFNLSTPAEEKALAEAADTLFLDVWEFTQNWADIRLREDDVPSLLGLLPNSLQKAYSNLMPDLAKTIYQSYPSITFADPSLVPNRADRSFTPALRTSDGVDNIFFRDYQPLSVIVPWMKLMASMFTTHVRMINIGTTYEGRDIPALRVGVSPNLPQEDQEPRKTIIISGGFHAREWISVSTVTYIAWSLITSYGKSPGITKLLQEFDFVLIPTANPDGYVYTWENDRLWRKNRQQTSLRFCRGLDLDRGFGFEWDGTSYQSNPCSESYPGDEPFQAVESHRLAEWAKNETDNNGVNFVGFLNLHSYSQQVLYPYSYSCAADPPSLENLEELGMGLAKAIRISSGQQYGVASACEGAVSSKLAATGGVSRMETGGGSAIDWFYHEMHVRYSYQVKLRDTGAYGFLLPKENIVPTGEEAFNAVKYFGDFLLGNKGIESNLVEEMHRCASSHPEAQKAEEEEQLVEDEDAKDYVAEINWELRRRRR
ncbi:zinc carboxypeptidase-like protein [Stipitochalara longipes BDJ]|nr:zinc carboxypeptidase-like protein [Stipitochalara longipes BDJ]